MNKVKVPANSNQEIVDTLQEILVELRELYNVLSFAMIFDTNRLTNYVESVIGTSKRRAEVYLATDGKETATAIAKQLGMKRPNVSIEQNILLETGLIQPYAKLGKGYIYKKSSIYEIVSFAGLLLMKNQREEEEEKSSESLNTNGNGESSA